VGFISLFKVFLMAAQKYKVFINEKVIRLEKEQSSADVPSDTLVVSVSQSSMIKEAIAKFEKNTALTTLVLTNTNVEKLLKEFLSLYSVIEAAGGLVKNKAKELLFIFRNGKWDLPKGKIEKGEGIKVAAIREVTEECGIAGLTIVRPLVNTMHLYKLKGKPLLKRTYWFEMNCADEKKLKPQLEEGITEAKWIRQNDLNKILSNTFPSILEVVYSAKSSV